MIQLKPGLLCIKTYYKIFGTCNVIKHLLFFKLNINNTVLHVAKFTLVYSFQCDFYIRCQRGKTYCLWQLLPYFWYIIEVNIDFGVGHRY